MYCTKVYGVCISPVLKSRDRVPYFEFLRPESYRSVANGVYSLYSKRQPTKNFKESSHYANILLMQTLYQWNNGKYVDF